MLPERPETVSTLSPGPEDPDEHQERPDPVANAAHTAILGVTGGPSRTVGISALWALDALFELPPVGVDRVNIHSYPGATYELFTFAREHGSWRAFVEPEYYGMLMFAQAPPPGSRLLGISCRTHDGNQLRA